MASKSYDVLFRVLGSLDPSLLNALQNASNKLRDLSNLNGKTFGTAQTLQGLKNQLKAVEKLRAAQQKLADLYRARSEAKDENLRLNRNRQAQQNQLNQMRQTLRDLQNNYNTNKSARGTRSDWAQAMREAIRTGKQEIREQEKLLRQLDREYDKSNDKIRRLGESLRGQQSQLHSLSQSANIGNLAGQESTLRAQIHATTQALNQEIAALERRNQILGRQSQASQNLSNAYSNFQNALQTADTLTSPFRNAIDAATEFEHTMSTLKSISQMDLISAGNIAQAESNMKRLTAQAKQLGATTIFTAQQIGEAQVYIARTGWNTDAIEKSVPHILKLAAANRMAIEPTADIVTNIMTAFGHDVSQIERDTDVLNYTVTHSNQTLSQMGEALKYAAPVAKLFGASLEEAAMMTKFMGDAGIQGSMAGTSMRQTMLRLTAPPKKASKAMDQLGISTSDATKSWNEAREVAASYGVTLDENLSAGRQFISIMEQIDKGFAGKSDREKLAAMSAITGINAVSGAANVFGAGAAQAKNFTELLENCRGALDQTYEVMTADTFGAQKSFESAWEAVKLSVGESLLSITKRAYNFATPILTDMSQFVDAHPGIVQAAAGIATSIAAATVAVTGFSVAMAGVRFAQAGFATAGLMFGNIATKITAVSTALRGLTLANIGASLSGASTAFTALGTAIAGAARAALMFVFSPVGAALMAIGIAAYYAYENWDRIAPALQRIGDALSGSLMPALESAGQALNNLGNSPAFQSLGNSIGNLADMVGGTLVGAFIILAGTVGTVLSGIVVGIAGLVKTIADLGTGLSEAFDKIADGNYAEGFKRIYDAGTQAAENFKNAHLDAYRTLKQGFIATDDALEMYMHPQVQPQTQPQVQTHGGGGGDFGAPTLDTSQAQSGLDAVGQSAQQVSTQMQGIQQFGTQFQTIATNAQTAGTNIQLIGTSAQTAGTNLQTVATNAQGAATSTQALGTSAGSATGGVEALGSSAGSAAGSISSMGAAAGAVAGALSAKAAEISSIHISVPTISVGGNAVASNAVASNASGGIYPKGAFLTTFAESSPEAAIPLDKSPRAFNLWQSAGQMLGILPGSPTVTAKRRRLPKLPTPTFPNLESQRRRLPKLPTPTFPQEQGSFNLPPVLHESSSPINLTIIVNISGNADESIVHRGVESALPAVESWSSQFGSWQRERRRRSFA